MGVVRCLPLVLVKGVDGLEGVAAIVASDIEDGKLMGEEGSRCHGDMGEEVRCNAVYITEVVAKATISFEVARTKIAWVEVGKIGFIGLAFTERWRLDWVLT
ncbi:hypothetical protein L7F22_014050 [Adiantum nelumboides]|nr:hypothetical protein [Adiantum nelumboides]